MRKFALAILILTIFISAAYAKCGTVTIHLTGIKEIKGNILIGLFNKAKGYPNIGKEYKGILIKVTKKSITHIFVDVPPGEYAIGIVHDINKNGTMDYSYIGWPQESYAVSGKPHHLGRPTFEKAKFKLKDKYTIKLKLK
jgi:uncharacterized protein (DUF2141 family)